MDFPLVLRRGFTPSGRPQTPVPPFGYTTEDVVFENDRDGASLAGTISYPVGYGHGMESCRPAEIPPGFFIPENSSPDLLRTVSAANALQIPPKLSYT